MWVVKSLTRLKGHDKLKEVYDKLKLVGDELKRRGYPARIKRNPQNQGGKIFCISLVSNLPKGQRAVQGHRKKDVRCSWYVRKGTLFTYWV